MSKRYNTVEEMINDLYYQAHNNPSSKERKEARKKIDLLWDRSITKEFGWTGKIAVKNWRLRGMKYWEELLKPEKVVFT